MIGGHFDEVAQEQYQLWKCIKSLSNTIKNTDIQYMIITLMTQSLMVHFNDGTCFQHLEIEISVLVNIK